MSSIILSNLQKADKF